MMGPTEPVEMGSIIQKLITHIQPTGYILDIGGQAVPHLISKFLKLVAVTHGNRGIYAGYHLPFATNYFDLVLIRSMSFDHADLFYWMQAAVRVLKPGHPVVVLDALMPDDVRAGNYINAFLRLSGAVPGRAYAVYEWRGVCLDVGLEVEQEEIYHPIRTLVPWAREQGCSQNHIERLQIMLAQAPGAVADWLQPRYASTQDAVFTMPYLTLVGRKGTNS